MRRIGKVVRLQVQRASLKVNLHIGDRNDRQYDPAPLLSVKRMDVDSNGVTGILPSNARVIDVHNPLHIDSKSTASRNDVSVGFTSHYDAMRRRFGPHLVDGIAGENIIVECDELFDQGTLGARLSVVSNGKASVRLDRPRAAEPCEPFSTWALRDPSLKPADPVIGQTLKFLRNGMRGYYTSCKIAGTIQIGDEIFVD